MATTLLLEGNRCCVQESPEANNKCSQGVSFAETDVFIATY